MSSLVMQGRLPALQEFRGLRVGIVKQDQKQIKGWCRKQQRKSLHIKSWFLSPALDFSLAATSRVFRPGRY